jgi:hypothetical protein
MSALRACLALVISIVVGGCGQGGETVAAPPVPPGFFGVNAQLLQPLPTTGRDAELELQLASLDDLGVDFVRANLDWRIIEPRPPETTRSTHDFVTTDAWVAALADHRLRWQVTGQGVPTPDWARDPSAQDAGCDYRSPPGDPADFAALMAAVARRYGRAGEFWGAHPNLPYEPIHQYEVWNEPNFANFWCPHPNPEAYGPLYDAVHAAVHRVDPAAEVVFGGLAGFTAATTDPNLAMPFDEFLRRALAAVPDLASRVDVLAVHPYAQTPAEALVTLGRFRDAADAVGLAGVPLAVNEFGWRTMGDGAAPLADEQQRAEYVAELTVAIAASSCDVIALALHTWITPETNPADPESWYGIADPLSGEAYPTADAYREQIGAIAGGGPLSEATIATDPCATTPPGD